MPIFPLNKFVLFTFVKCGICVSVQIATRIITSKHPKFFSKNFQQRNETICKKRIFTSPKCRKRTSENTLEFMWLGICEFVYFGFQIGVLLLLLHKSAVYALETWLVQNECLRGMALDVTTICTKMCPKYNSEQTQKFVYL